MADIGNVKTLVEEKERVSLGKSSDESLGVAAFEPRYDEVTILGEGGMGEVRLVRDTVIGRDVAVKRVRGPMAHDATSRERFLREARIQGQLEHPAIVPVYDLARTPDGRIYFTMRRVRGRTFEGRDVRMSRRAMLSAMSRVLLAIDFAHARGVIHRDLKPSNLMLGDWGEVYVLDWGLAKLTGSADPLALASSQENEAIGSGKTTLGSILGTPGYMSPEQTRGEEVDERSDVYALGACLFEALAEIPLFEIGPVQAMLATTLSGANARVSDRAPEADVPVELEAICVRATMTNPDERFQTAREMSDAIERFLEGDRDLERRRVRAREHAAKAHELVESAAAGPGEAEARGEAMREVGRALANDPDNADARRVLVRLLTEPPRTVPAEVHEEIANDRERLINTARKRVALAFLSALVPNIVILFMGVRDLPWFIIGNAAGFGGAVCVILPQHVFWRERRLLVALLAMLGLVSTARIASPLVLVPVMALCLGVGFTLYPRKTNATLSMLAAFACIAIPFALEWTGVLPPSFHATGDTIVIEARLAHLPQTTFLIWFFVATLLPITATCVYLAHVRDRLSAAEERIRLQAWQLRQILPPT